MPEAQNLLTEQATITRRLVSLVKDQKTPSEINLYWYNYFESKLDTWFMLARAGNRMQTKLLGILFLF